MIPAVVKQLLGSEKAVAVGLLIIAASALTATGQMTIDEWMDYTKWLAGIYVGGKSLQGAAEALARRPAAAPAPRSSQTIVAVGKEPGGS